VVSTGVAKQPLSPQRQIGNVAMEVSKLNLDARSSRCLKAQSSLVRRLVQARDDPAKRRIRHWLSDINDEQLLAFGLTQEDIALLRGPPEGPHACKPKDKFNWNM
jgi:hypothetical protein